MAVLRRTLAAARRRPLAVGARPRFGVFGLDGVGEECLFAGEPENRLAGEAIGPLEVVSVEQLSEFAFDFNFSLVSSPQLLNLPFNHHELQLCVLVSSALLFEPRLHQTGFHPFFLF